MAQIDVIKEQINYLKVWLGIFVVTLIGLIGWVVSTYEQMNGIKLGLSILAVIGMLIFIHLLNKRILQKIASLGDL